MPDCLFANFMLVCRIREKSNHGWDKEHGPGSGRTGTGLREYGTNGLPRWKPGTGAVPHWTRSRGLAAAGNRGALVLRRLIWRERAAGEGACGRSGGGAVSDDRMQGGGA
jgi:hypothetical protein